MIPALLDWARYPGRWVVCRIEELKDREIERSRDSEIKKGLVSKGARSVSANERTRVRVTGELEVS